MPDDGGGPRKTVWANDIGLITRRSQDQILPPPPRAMHVSSRFEARKSRFRVPEPGPLLYGVLSLTLEPHQHAKNAASRGGVCRKDVTLIMVMSSVEVGSDSHYVTGFVPCS
jgi:hypothetical protein